MDRYIDRWTESIYVSVSRVDWHPCSKLKAALAASAIYIECLLGLLLRCIKCLARLLGRLCLRSVPWQPRGRLHRSWPGWLAET